VKPAPVDKASNVSQTSLVTSHQEAPTVASTLPSDTSIQATTQLPGKLASSADTRGQFRGSSTGLSLEICGISLSPSRHSSGGSGENCDAVLSSTPVKEVKHCLDFDESDTCIGSQCKRVCVREESNVYNPSADNHRESRVSVNTDSSRSFPRKNVVFHASMPISVPQSLSDPDKFSTVTPVAQRLHKFLVGLFFSFRQFCICS